MNSQNTEARARLEVNALTRRDKALIAHGLTPLDLAPNSVLNISNFIVYCEVFLQIEPSLSLFIETFYCKDTTPSRDTAK